MDTLFNDAPMLAVSVAVTDERASTVTEYVPVSVKYPVLWMFPPDEIENWLKVQAALLAVQVDGLYMKCVSVIITPHSGGVYASRRIGHALAFQLPDSPH